MSRVFLILFYDTWLRWSVPHLRDDTLQLYRPAATVDVQVVFVTSGPRLWFFYKPSIKGLERLKKNRKKKFVKRELYEDDVV